MAVTPRLPELRSPFARAVGPVAAGILFIAVLALITWGVAAFLANNSSDPTDNLVPTELPLGSAAQAASVVKDQGPILLPSLSSDGLRSYVLFHDGDDPNENWRIFEAHPNDEAATCTVEQVVDTRMFTDCLGRTVDVMDLALPTNGARPRVDDGRLFLDLSALSPTPATTEP